MKRSPCLSARQRDADFRRMNRHLNPNTAGSVCLFVVSSGGEQSDERDHGATRLLGSQAPA